MDNSYRLSMQEQLAELAEEFSEINRIIVQEGYANKLVYRAAERNLQLLVEACIGVTKQTLKERQVNVPNEARAVFIKLKSMGLDQSQIPWNKVIGMRNALVHDYLNLEPERVLEVITQRHYVALFEFAQKLLTV